MRIGRAIFALALCSAVGCSTAGTSWMAQPLTAGEDEDWDEELSDPPDPTLAQEKPRSFRHKQQTVVIADTAVPGEPEEPHGPTAPVAHAKPAKLEGRVLGSFRNTYYDFPSEAEHSGASVPLKNPSCKTIADVPRGFFESVCVQGSGTLKRGSTVSFAKRDCECAEVCPRTSQKICFDELDKTRFPWGRGATGNPITPLLTVAVDTNVIPLNTAVYIPEYDGLPRDASETAVHDGCFIAQDRGLKIKDKHVDIFTGYEAITKLWNRLVPSNKGVTVVLDSPRCARANVELAEAPREEEKPAKKRAAD